jgi:hypothetical protein
MKNRARMAVDTFIEKMAIKLPYQYQFVRMDKTYMSGAELMLTGTKLPGGKPIDPNQTYEIPTPVIKGTLKTGVPMPKVIDHRHFLRLAYLRNGIEGMADYLKKYLPPNQIEMVKKHFMQAVK